MNQTNEPASSNPFMKPYGTLYDVPPFDNITNADFIPAIKEGINQQQEQIDKIGNNDEAPTFENTIEALEFSGKLLTRVNNVFSNLRSSNTNEELQAIAKKVAPLNSKNRDDINLNAQLFDRIRTV